MTSFFSVERVHADTVAVEASTSRSRKMLANNAIWIGLWGPFSVSGAADRGRRMSLSKAKLHDCRAGPMPRRTERVTQAEVCCSRWLQSCPSSICALFIIDTKFGYDL